MIDLKQVDVNVIHPRVKGFTHKSVIAIAGECGLTDNHEVVDDVPSYLLRERNRPHMIFTSTPEYLLNRSLKQYSDSENIKVRFTISDNKSDDGAPRFSEAKIGRFIIEPNDGKRRVMHTIFDPSRAFGMSRIDQWKDYSTIESLLRLGMDIREWCEQEGVPFGPSFPSIASSLARDRRFWPDSRRPVPRATNARLRKSLPGVYQERSHPKGVVIPEAVGIDQARAFHNICQTVGVPDRQTLFAKGFFDNPDDAARLWAPADSELYRNIVFDSYGLVAAVLRYRGNTRRKFRNPVSKSVTHTKSNCVRYVWTNELPDIADDGIEVLGLTAAWTSDSIDEGFKLYGKYAEDQILAADAMRKEWLKPCLHCIYGLMAAHDRQFTISSNSTDKGEPTVKRISGFEFDCNETTVRGVPSIANVAVLGVLQSEVRRRSLHMANRYSDRVTHIHADGLHLKGEVIPNLPSTWTADRVTNLVYLDNVSYISDEGDTLPGRYGKDRVSARRNAVASVRRQAKSRRRRGNSPHKRENVNQA